MATAQDRLVGFCTRLLIRGSALGALAAVQELGNFGERYRRTSLNYGLPTDSKYLAAWMVVALVALAASARDTGRV